VKYRHSLPRPVHKRDVDLDGPIRNLVLGGGACWRYLANTIKPFECCGDAGLCQVTLTICYYL